MADLLWFEKICPRCRAFATVTPVPRADPRWLFRAKIIIVAGSAASALMAWMLISFVTRPLYEFLKDLEELRSARGLIGILVYVVCFLVALIPGLICGRVAAGMPKVRMVSCSNCRWRGTQLMRSRRQRDPEDGGDVDLNAPEDHPPSPE